MDMACLDYPSIGTFSYLFKSRIDRVPSYPYKNGWKPEISLNYITNNYNTTGQYEKYKNGIRNIYYNGDYLTGHYGVSPGVNTLMFYNKKLDTCFAIFIDATEGSLTHDEILHDLYDIPVNRE